MNSVLYLKKKQLFFKYIYEFLSLFLVLNKFFQIEVLFETIL